MDGDYSIETLVREVVEDTHVASFEEACEALCISILQKLKTESRAYLMGEDGLPYISVITPFLRDNDSLWHLSFSIESLAGGLVDLRDSKEELITMAESFEKAAKDFRAEADRMEERFSVSEK